MPTKNQRENSLRAEWSGIELSCTVRGAGKELLTVAVWCLGWFGCVMGNKKSLFAFSTWHGELEILISAETRLRIEKFIFPFLGGLVCLLEFFFFFCVCV